MQLSVIQQLYDLLNVDNQFAENSTEVNPKYMGRLAEATNLLKEHKSLDLVVTGHADASGPEEYNDKLALGRAKQVERYQETMDACLEFQKRHAESGYQKEIDSRKLIYEYWWIDLNQAAKRANRFNYKTQKYEGSVYNPDGDLVAIDGKTIRRSYDKNSNKSAIHVVSA